MKRLLLFGGSFNPIHHGHLIVARTAAEALGIERVVLVPSARSPHKTGEDLAPADDRLQMCRAAVAGDPMFDVSDWELTQPPPSYTLHTLRHFRTAHPDSALYWLIGMDSLRELTTWHRVRELASECTVVTVSRGGVSAPDLSEIRATLMPQDYSRLVKHILPSPALEISASDIRQRVRVGLPIAYLTPPSVDAHIRARRLYGA